VAGVPDGGWNYYEKERVTEILTATGDELTALTYGHSQSLDSTVSAENQTTYADLIASNSAGPVREATSREFSALVAECMTRLPANQREILLLRNVRQHTYREIARMMGITIGTVKSRVCRARETLRTLLAGSYAEGDTPEAGTSSQWFESSRPAGLLVGTGN
jgi:RNA polymerase sigma-70 factor (ECF subfamily)